ncbi:MAG: M14 family zinc carboxypeptidase [Myxococcota bacterium]
MAFTPYSGDTYIDVDTLDAWCASLVKALPRWFACEEIGRSRLGRPIYMVTVGHEAAAQGCPAIWIDAGTHASEWTGVCAASRVLSAWAERLERGDAELEQWFSEHAAFVVPCVSPDGVQSMMDGGPFVRSSLRPPRDGTERTGFVQGDVDGDGSIRWMRWRHPAGSMVEDPDVPMFMRHRTLDDDPDDAFFLCSEGSFVQWDGSSWVRASRAFGVDLNRNFPANWGPFSMFGMDGGLYTLSEPEARAITDAVAERPTIGAALTFHTYTGCVLTQPYRQDTPLHKGDLDMMEALARDLVAGTGYDVYRVCPDFMYDPKKPIVGVWADALATTFGIPGYTVEFWSPYLFAGVQVEKPAEFLVDPDEDVIRELVRAASDIPGGVMEWRPFEHPQLGRVELGGIDYLRSIRNPPEHMLADECAKGVVMAERLRRAIPEVRVEVRAEALGGALTKITLHLENTGFLPTSALAHAETIASTPACSVGLELSGDLELVSGEAARELEHLNGWGALRVTSARHAVYSNLPKRAHAHASTWVVRGGGVATVRYSAGRAGRGEQLVEVGG